VINPLSVSVNPIGKEPVILDLRHVNKKWRFMFECVSKALQYVIIKMGFYSISKSDYHHIIQGRIQGGGGGGGRTRRAPTLKLEKKIWRKIVIFHTKYPQNFRPSLRNWKKYDFFGVKS
jgi:hypothetical protein